MCNHLQLPTPLFLNNLWVSTIILYISKIHGFHGTHGTYTNYAFVLYCWVLSSTRDKFCLFLVKVAAKLCCNFKLFFSYIECDKSLDWTLLNWTWAETNIQLSLLIFHHRVLSEKLTFEVSKIIKTESRIKFFKWTGPCNRCCNPSNLEAWILGWLEEELGSYSVCTSVSPMCGKTRQDAGSVTALPLALLWAVQKCMLALWQLWNFIQCRAKFNRFLYPDEHI